MPLDPTRTRAGAPRLPGIGSHQSAVRRSDDWLTPRHILTAFPAFDLDPCASIADPIRCAPRYYTQQDDGLGHKWDGTVFVNPPYSDVAPWMAKLARHSDGIALVFARTETEWWQTSIWPFADAILFLAGRLSFIRSDTLEPASHNSGGPSALVAFGPKARGWLALCRLPGAFIGPAHMLSTK